MQAGAVGFPNNAYFKSRVRCHAEDSHSHAFKICPFWLIGYWLIICISKYFDKKKMWFSPKFQTTYKLTQWHYSKIGYYCALESVMNAEHLSESYPL